MEEINDPEVILSYLKVGVIEEALTEVRLDGGDEVFASFMAGEAYLPGAEGDLAASFHSVGRKRLLLLPLEPSEGDGLIGKSAKVSLRFFDGLHFLAGVTGLDPEGAGEDNLHHLAFPEKLGRVKLRKVLRTPISKQGEMEANVKRQGLTPFKASVFDLSMTGIGIELPEGQARPEIDAKVSVELSSRSMGKIPLLGRVRNFVTVRNGGGERVTRCGIAVKSITKPTDFKRMREWVDLLETRRQNHIKMVKLKAQDDGGE